MPEALERTAIEDTGSLSDHEEQFNGRSKRGVDSHTPEVRTTEADQGTRISQPNTAAGAADISDAAKEATEAALEDARDPNGRYRVKHRAEKDKARPQDVPRIRELSGKVKDLEKERDEWKTKWETVQRQPVVPVEPPRAAVQPPAQTTATTFAQPEPKIEDFASADDPYLALNRAWAKWDRLRERFEEQQTTAQQTREQQTHAQREAQIQRGNQEFVTYNGKLQNYLQAHPDHAPAFGQLPAIENPLMLTALVRADNGPELVYTLTQQPALLAELHLITEGKPVSDQHVALATQWLQTRVLAGTTAAAAAPKLKSPPKPPTAVRTGPMQTGSEPPGDGASLADHEAFYTRKRR